MVTKIKVYALIFAFFLISKPAKAEDNAQQLQVKETKDAVEIQLPAQPAAAANAKETPKTTTFDPLKYTLGPDDAVEITVMRHPEFSGVYPINREGKLQYKFVGDIDATGLTKQQLEKKVKEAISAYVISPEINVTITEYKSKIFYVIGEVSNPGRYFMRSEAIPVSEAIFQSGLPTQSAAMRKAQLITPDRSGNPKIRHVDLYGLLYGGDLKKDVNMMPGDVLYVPSTVMAKVIRVINPVATTVGLASSSPDNVGKARTGMDVLTK